MRLPAEMQKAPGWPRRVKLELTPGPGESLDAICGGEVELLQHERGYRFNLDPVLLAHFAMEHPLREGPVIDLGTGTAIIPLILVKKFQLANVTGLEIQPSLYALAHRNVQRNRAERRIALVRGDLCEVRRQFVAGGFQTVLSNPPYRAASAGRTSPQAEKAVARHEVLCALDDVAGAGAHLLRSHGAMGVIYPASRSVELFEALRAHGLEPKRIRFVHPRQGAKAKRVLVEAVKGGRAGVQVDPPLWIHAAAARFAPEVRQMLEG